MQWLSTLDVLFVQLILIPTLVIAVGVCFAKLTDRIFIGPLITLVAALEINYWYFSAALPEAAIPPIMIASWAILFPLLSLFFSWIAVSEAHERSIKVFE